MAALGQLLGDLGRLLAPLGRSLGTSWMLLGRSWASLGWSGATLGWIWGPGELPSLDFRRSGAVLDKVLECSGAVFYDVFCGSLRFLT